MLQHVNICRKHILICILWLNLTHVACRTTQPTPLKLAPVAEGAGPCEALDDADSKAVCEHAHLTLLQQQTRSSYNKLVIEYDERFMGDPMTLSIDGDCLASASGKVVSERCRDFDENFKWHFVDIEVEYTWGGGVKFYDLAFHAVTRSSMKRWHQHNKQMMPTPKLECLDFYDVNRPDLRFRLAKLRIVPCEESNLVFLTVPNDTVGDRNLYGSRWARILAVDTRLPQYAALKTAMSTLNPMLTRPCEPGCTSDTRLLDTLQKAQRINLGEIRWNKDTFVLIRGEFDPESGENHPLFELVSGDFVGQQATKLCTEQDPCSKRKDNLENEIFIGGCVPHRSDGEERCFLEDHQPLSTYKMLYHAIHEKRRGHVVQLRPEDNRCLLWNGQTRSCSGSKEIDKPDGEDSSQFRLAVVKAPRGKTEAFVQLQRVFPDAGQSNRLCYDLPKKAAVTCCLDADQCPNTYAYLLHWPPQQAMPSLVFRDPTTNSDQQMQLQICQTATNTQQFLAYDCVDYVAPIWKVLKTFADIIYLIPELGTIPSFVLQSILCQSGEQTVATEACREVAIQGLTAMAGVLLDNTTVTGITAVALRLAIANQTIKPNAAIVEDFTKSPALAAVVRDIVYRTAKTFMMSTRPESLADTLARSLQPVAASIIKSALKQGVNGGSLTTAYTTKTIDDMIQSAVQDMLRQIQ